MPTNRVVEMLEMAEKITSSVQTASAVVIPTSLLVNLGLSFIMQLLWSFMNDLSFMTMQTLITIR